ncbi:unnamed protein product [Chondrus crispus]|uniref:Uncharacterized protein n=1 Tax=Chondrus crispus TaxID=2769 RepID=R7QCY2_CHOCR|nr:unnamed protein product [Chondrus crispus]CDF35924.1 unnamed protein product [Chondrus crispus]|eukprot:XP_005715743.1 unnamed protein product [Chondrus crispus]
MPRTPRAAAKGVEFSDEPIILGAPASSTATTADHSPSIYQSHHSSEPHLHISPADVALRPPGKRRARFHSDQSLTLNHVEEPLETSCTDSDASASIPSSPLHPIAKKAFLAAQYDGTPQNEKLVEQSTRINTKLNSMPSGGAFSFMNSSEDIVSDSLDTSDSDTETASSTDDDLRSSRRMIRVDGSAKLSSASGLNDDDFLDDDDDDGFGIEGAERVDEEEDIQVRSFGRSFARVSLKDGEDVIIRDPRKKDGARSEVAFALPGSEEDGGRRRSSSVRVPDRPRPLESDGDSGLRGMNTSRSDPPRRKSRMRLTFNKRAATANAVKNAQRKSMERNSIDRTSVDRTSVDRDGVARPSIDRVLATRSMQPDVDMSSDTDSDVMMTGSCFPSRKGTASRRRTRSSTSNVKPGASVDIAWPQQDKSKLGGWGRKKSQAAGQLVSPPDMSNMVEGRRRHPSPERKIVKNVSLQKDDWIDFATNAARSQRHPWLVRVLSANRMSSPAKKQTRPIAAQTEQDKTRKKSKRFWRVFSRKSK